MNVELKAIDMKRLDFDLLNSSRCYQKLEDENEDLPPHLTQMY